MRGSDAGGDAGFTERLPRCWGKNASAHADPGGRRGHSRRACSCRHQGSGSKRVIINDAGHLTYLEPEEFSRVAMLFIESNSD
jgi:hypothetical protein